MLHTFSPSSGIIHCPESDEPISIIPEHKKRQGKGGSAVVPPLRVQRPLERQMPSVKLSSALSGPMMCVWGGVVRSVICKVSIPRKG